MASPRELFLALPFAALAPLVSYAEQYLTLEQAQNAVFPDGKYFVDCSTTLTEEEVAAIKEASGTKPQTDTTIIFSVKDLQSENLGYFLTDKVIGKHDFISYALGIKPDGSVQNVEIMEYLEQYGSEIVSSQWRRQFEGKTSSEPFELTSDVKNISGATLSCKHVTDGVKRLLVTLQLLQKRENFPSRASNAS